MGILCNTEGVVDCKRCHLSDETLNCGFTWPLKYMQKISQHSLGNSCILLPLSTANIFHLISVTNHVGMSRNGVLKTDLVWLMLTIKYVSQALFCFAEKYDLLTSIGLATVRQRLLRQGQNGSKFIDSLYVTFPSHINYPKSLHTFSMRENKCPYVFVTLYKMYRAKCFFFLFRSN